MNDDRQAYRFRASDLSPKDFNLNVTRAVIVIIIQADLAPRDDFFTGSTKLYKMRLRQIVIKLCIMGVNTQCRIDIILFLSKSNRAFEISTMRIARSDIEHCDQSRFSRSFDDLISIVFKLLSVYVAVGIDEHLLEPGPDLHVFKKRSNGRRVPLVELCGADHSLRFET